MASTPFKPHMSLDSASQLKVSDMVDYRMSTGEFKLMKITMKSGTNLKLFADEWSTWCNYSTELHRLATAKSITKRPANRFQDLQNGHCIDINPTQRHHGWKLAEIKQIDDQSGQIQVMYEHDNRNYIYWTHLDNTEEVSEATTKSCVTDPTKTDNRDDTILNLALQMSMNNDNNVNPDDVNTELQQILQLSINENKEIDEENKQNDINASVDYNKDVVNQLVILGFDRNECILASSMVIDYNDINRVADQVQMLKESDNNSQLQNINELTENKILAVSRPNNKMKIFMKELEELIGIIQKRLDFMDQQDSVVEMLIFSSSSKSLLQSAKQKALNTEKNLLEQIMNLHEINTFLNDIIMVENLFNSQYDEKQKKQQREARRMFARNIETYENKPKPKSEVDSFVELLFAGTNLHIGSFRSWLQRLHSYCPKFDIRIHKYGEAKGKNIERAFYKAFYVYGMKHNDGFKQMTDVLRCSLVFKTFKDLYKCFALIEKYFGPILRCKDRFNKDKIPFGYRDLLININCPGSKIVCEIQLHHMLFYQYKDISHKIYKKARLFDQDGVNLAYTYADKHNRKHVGNTIYKVDNLNGSSMDENKQDINGSVSPANKLLKEWNLDQYSQKLVDDMGYDDIEDWRELKEDQLLDMGFKQGHVMKFLRKVKELNLK